MTDFPLPSEATEQVTIPQVSEEVPTRIESNAIHEHGTIEQIGALYGAVAKAQGGFGEVKKTAQVDFTGKGGRVRYSYAPLANLTAAVRAPLAEAGVAVLQPFTMVEGEGVIRTILAHSGGGRIESVVTFRPEGDIKTLGGQTTYLARYALCRLLMLDGVEDADAVEESTPSGAKAPPKQRQAPTPSARAKSKPKAEEGPPPPGDEDAPPTEAPDPLTREQGATLRNLVEALKLAKTPMAELCLKQTGVMPQALTKATADKFIAHLKGMVAEATGEKSDA